MPEQPNYQSLYTAPDQPTFGIPAQAPAPTQPQQNQIPIQPLTEQLFRVPANDITEEMARTFDLPGMLPSFRHTQSAGSLVNLAMLPVMSSQRRAVKAASSPFFMAMASLLSPNSPYMRSTRFSSPIVQAFAQAIAQSQAGTPI
jgi:hypothetical protein